MTKIIDANKECEFEGQFVLFDTNIWIYIYGNDPRGDEAAIYSEFYNSLLKAGNTVIVNEQIISEFFNRFCKLEFEALFGRSRGRQFKKLRKTSDELKEKIEGVKDICLEILEDCVYQQSNLEEKCLMGNLTNAAKGELDLTDAALVSECIAGGYVLVSHDADFAMSDIKFATANGRVLQRAV
jgi:predicted nucleic acid-binding protein